MFTNGSRYLGPQKPPGQSQLDTDDLDDEERKALAEVSKKLGGDKTLALVALGSTLGRGDGL